MLQDPRENLLELLEQRQIGQAQYQLRRILEDDPEDAPTRALLALCLADLEHWEEATTQARQAVALEPELAFCQWALGAVLAGRHRFGEALPVAEEAARLDPENPDHYALLARCHAGKGRWDAALLHAERGLELDPDHPGCNNLRALALQQRGHSAEADQAFVDAAALDPDNAFARAGRGWASLQAGAAPGEALPHFYHALQIDPASEWAHTGLLAALKARNPVYRLMLKYFLWMGSLSPRTRMLIVVGGILGYNQLRRLATAQPQLAPAIYPLLGLYILFLLLSWTADPLFDFLLRFDPVGRTVVNHERRVASNWVVGTLALAVAALVVGLATGINAALLFAFLAGIMVLPIAGTFQCEPGWPRTVMGAYTALLASAALLGVVLPRESGGILIMIAVLGVVLGSWMARGLAGVVPAR